jgi:D-glycero-beta-D-manno-heptose-7-phosphate kinase
VVDLTSRQILLVGDLCLDTYTRGRVERISPEAPVPVLHQQSTSHRPGMAGNTACNLLALEQRVRLLSRIGDDEAGERLRASLRAASIDTDHLIVDHTTSEKNRLIAGQQQICRIDTEAPEPLSPSLESRLIESLPSLLSDIDLCAISDYGKGFLTPTLLRALLLGCAERNIPTVVDPKGRDFSRYRGATLIKPNTLEAITAAGLGAEASLDDVAATLLSETQVQALMVTRSEHGIALFTPQGRSDFPTRPSEVRDVTGAGDTVLATISASLANGHSLSDACTLANRAAALAVQHIGCVAVPLSDLRMNTYVAS